jgi:hypothetical protein
MKTKIAYTEDPEDMEMRSGLSDKLKAALKAIEEVANEPVPPNQLALRTFYINTLNNLATAYNKISNELYDTFDESYRKGVYDDRDKEFVDSVISQIAYEPTSGGRRTRMTKRTKRKSSLSRKFR